MILNLMALRIMTLCRALFYCFYIHPGAIVMLGVVKQSVMAPLGCECLIKLGILTFMARFLGVKVLLLWHVLLSFYVLGAFPRYVS